MAGFNPDLSKFIRMHARSSDPPSPPTKSGGSMDGRNPFLRCIMPQSVTLQPDSLRQYYQGGVPQYRIIPPLQHGIRPEFI